MKTFIKATWTLLVVTFKAWAGDTQEWKEEGLVK